MRQGVMMLAPVFALVLSGEGAAKTVRRSVAKPPATAPAKPAVATPTPKPPAADEPPSPSPIGSPGAWFPPDAYPPEARAAGQEGRTAFAVDVDAQGRVVACNIIGSSGSPLLDTTTCSLVIANGRFTPARGKDGKAVAGVWQSAMRWKLVADDYAPEDTEDLPPPRFPPPRPKPQSDDSDGGPAPR